MPGHQIKGERCLPITIEIGPIHRDDDFLARSDQMWNPAGEAVPDVDVLVAEKPVNLLDRVFGHQSARLRQCLTDYRDRQRRAGHHAQCRPGQAIDPLGMKVMPIQIVNERANILQPSTKPTLHFSHDTPANPPALNML